jgi:SNF2 family DNA or RNA helicase
MLIVHGSWLDANLLIWGETPASTSGIAPARRGSRRKQPPASPYAAKPDALVEALLAAGYSDARSAAPLSVFLWSPTTDGLPVASSALIAPAPSQAGRATLAPWTVTALRPSLVDLFTILSAAPRAHTLAQGIVVGTDLAFWGNAFLMAASLVARGRFMPGVALLNAPESEPVHVARWLPLVSMADADRVQTLTSGIPNACLALSFDATTAPLVSPRTAVLEFVGDCVDRLVRGFEPHPVPPETRPARTKRTADAPANVHDAWTAALRSANPTIAGKASDVAKLAADVAAWRRPVVSAEAGPFRLCFRLQEPAQAGQEWQDGQGTETEGRDVARPFSRGPRDAEYASWGGSAANEQRATSDEQRAKPATSNWSIEYLLQAADDPSLVVAASDVWQPNSRGRRLLAARAGDPRTFMLQALGQAAALSPHIAASLQEREPNGCDLDVTAAYAFLTHGAWVLDQAGFGVLLPSWWTRRGARRLAARAKVKAPAFKGSDGISLEQLVTVHWEIALGDDPMSLEELRALATAKTPLVSVRGQWVEVSADDRKRALALVAKGGRERMRAGDLVRLAIGAAPAAGGLTFEGVVGEGWIRDLVDRLEARTPLEEISTPPTFTGVLRPYQARGYAWLAFLRRWGLGACLADDMGLGKTVQTLALIDRDYHTADRRPVLLVCPTSVVGNWQKEAARFTPDLPVLVHHGQTRARHEAFVREANSHGLVISSYALLGRDLDALRGVDWRGVILDEAQNIKNPDTRQAQSARALPGGYRAALTGTPVENHVGDLWSIMEFLNPGLLGTRADFKRRYLIPIQAMRDPAAVDALKRITGPFVLRRLKTDPAIAADLPAKLEMNVFCTLTREQASLYAAVVADMETALARSEGIQRKGMVLATLSKLKQVCNHPAQFLGDASTLAGRSGKLARLTEMIDEILQVSDRALVFTQFAEMGGLIQRHLQETFGQETPFLHGGTPKPARDLMVERFQAGEGGPIFVLSLKAGGTGLNLTRANHVFLFDRWWNPAVENQAIDRAFRIGQRRDVQVHKFLCVGTLEERINELIERKKTLAEQVVGTGEAWLTELSTEELKAVFALRPDAVV